MALSTAAPAVSAEKAKAYAFGWSRLEGAEGCIGARELAARVEAQLEQRPFVPASQADRSVEGRIGPRPGGGWRAVLQLSDARGAVIGTRELTSDESDCHALDEGLTLSVALMIEPDSVSTWATKPGGGVPGTPGVKAALEGDEPAREAAPAGRAPAASPPQRAPAKATAPANDRAAKGARPFEIEALAGYAFGDGALPPGSPDTVSGVSFNSPISGGLITPPIEQFSGGFEAGVGLRMGQTFRSGVWLGGSFTYYFGSSVRQAYSWTEADGRAYPETDSRTYKGLVGGSFRAYAPGLELGYVFPIGPLEARPYVGLGLMAYSLDWSIFIGHLVSSLGKPRKPRRSRRGGAAPRTKRPRATALGCSA